MKIKALVRFNHRDPGEVFDAEKEDAKKWIDTGFAEKAGKDAEAKEESKPPEDKMMKEPAKKK